MPEHLFIWKEWKSKVPQPTYNVILRHFFRKLHPESISQLLQVIARREKRHAWSCTSSHLRIWPRRRIFDDDYNVWPGWEAQSRFPATQRVHNCFNRSGFVHCAFFAELGPTAFIVKKCYDNRNCFYLSQVWFLSIPRSICFTSNRRRRNVRLILCWYWLLGWMETLMFNFNGKFVWVVKIVSVCLYQQTSLNQLAQVSVDSMAILTTIRMIRIF